MSSDTPRYILTSGALVAATDGLGNPCGDWVKYSDHERDLAAANERADKAEEEDFKSRMPYHEQRERAERAEAIAEQCRIDTEIAERHQLNAEAERDALKAAILQIKALAEYATTGPNTSPRCKSGSLTATQATSLRGAISEICDAAIDAAYAKGREDERERCVNIADAEATIEGIAQRIAAAIREGK